MESLLDELQAFIDANPLISFFRPGAHESAIDAAETTIGMPIPADYRAFLKRFDGGFISLVGGCDEPD
jgi:cell wall assembly regulator SMI1